MIHVDKLSKSFGPTLAVDGISFSVNRGEVVGFLGPNGAGKTTTMRLLTRYLSADSGRIEIDGTDVEHDEIAARRKIGYLPESAPLYNDLTVVEYLRYVASIRRIPKASRRARIRDMVEVCGLKEVLSRYVGVLSKGYRQRVGLAQTMIHDPTILILDEPTTGLDPNQRIEIRDLIKEIGRERTIIISTHILSEVQSTCGRVLIINRGKIVADGKPDELEERKKDEEIYLIRARCPRAAMEKVLTDAPFVSRFEEGESEDQVCTYKVHGSPENGGLGESLFKVAVDSSIVLVELRKEAVSLESIFASLTLGEPGE